MTYEEIQEKYPQEFAARDANKFRYRYPRGEVFFLNFKHNYICSILNNFVCTKQLL